MSQQHFGGGLPGWSAPLIGILVVVALYGYLVIVNQEEFDPLYLLLFAGIGGSAGLLLWGVDIRRRARRRNKKPPQPYAPLPEFIGATTNGEFRARYECVNPPPKLTPRQLRGLRLKAWGAGLLALCMGVLMVGRLVVADFFPQFSESGLTGANLAWLVPLWSTGLIGIGLWITGGRLSRAIPGPEEPNKSDDRGEVHR